MKLGAYIARHCLPFVNKKNLGMLSPPPPTFFVCVPKRNEMKNIRI